MTETRLRSLSCPKCQDPLPDTDGSIRCGGCSTAVSVVSFTPLLSAATLSPGEGRCQAHPTKDAVDACERCGGFVCDVCATRTGEHLLCPACFDWKHDREELETTVTRRMRWDVLTFVMFLASGACNLTTLVALVTACITLWKRRTERYLSPVGSYLVLFLTFASIAIVVIAIASGID